MSKMTFNEFMQSAREEMNKFEKNYLENHKDAPSLYPLEIDKDNEGLWWEMFMTFSD